MIISHSKKFIFIHGRKTAGSSIGISLMRYLGSGDVVRGYITGGVKHGIYPPDWTKSIMSIRPKDFLKENFRVQAYRRYVKQVHDVSSTHLGALEIKKMVGKDIWNQYYKFTFERNPFDRIVSFYYWRTKDHINPPGFKKFIHQIKEGNNEWLTANKLDGFLNYPLYTIDNKVAVNKIGRFENLHNDLEIICNKIDIEFDGWLPKNKSGVRKKISLNELYNKKLIEDVSEIFSEEISSGNYNFDTFTH
ncbi:MAG: sulfotransferase family 2 domain-containing protein [Candidatus Woykebacteria bacterium]